MREINLKNEADFENSKVLNVNVRKNQNKFYDAVKEYIVSHKKITCETIKNKTTLEIGCSSGYDSIDYAKYCKYLYSCDISDEAIKKAKLLKLKNVEFICSDAHKLPYENEKFDFVIVNSLLHHLDLNVIFEEIKRVLKKDGCLIFKEPLGINPIFNLYRYLTPNDRTKDERPFTWNDLTIFWKYFETTNIKYSGFLILISAYVKNKNLKNVLKFIDDKLSKTIFKYFYWMITGISRIK